MKNKKQRKIGMNLSPAQFMISASLVDGGKHGYAIAKQINQYSSGQVQFSAGTLYSNLSNMVDSGLIKLQSTNYTPRTQKVYRLTDTGQNNYVQQSEMLKNFINKSEDDNEQKGTGSSSSG